MSRENIDETSLHGMSGDQHRQGENNSHSNGEEVSTSAVNLISQYLCDKVVEFQSLTELRRQGWKSAAGDKYFQQQRDSADGAGEKLSKIFYNMMRKIAQELNDCTGALKLASTGTKSPMILDMCMAPGGFLTTTLGLNPEASALAFTLPSSDGGHEVFLPSTPRVTIEYHDITMLAADLGVSGVANDHPLAKSLLPQQIKSGQLFNLVLCDGQVLRTHVCPAYKEAREARRLTIIQLAIGLKHLHPGGTMIVLLHKVEAPETIILLRTFERFATVRLFKPKRYHAKRSSFYMIATDIQSGRPEAIQTVNRWTRQWETATFGTDEEYEQELSMERSNTAKVLADFGPRLIELGRGIWERQEEALRKAPWTKA